MDRTLRGRASDAMMESAFDDALDRQQLEAKLATISPQQVGHREAQQALATARRLESARLWLAWRLQPRGRR